jgi:hypothetical protein
MTRPAGKPLQLASENCPLDTFRSSSYGIPVACSTQCSRSRPPADMVSADNLTKRVGAPGDIRGPSAGVWRIGLLQMGEKIARPMSLIYAPSAYSPSRVPARNVAPGVVAQTAQEHSPTSAAPVLRRTRRLPSSLPLWKGERRDLAHHGNASPLAAN